MKALKFLTIFILAALLFTSCGPKEDEEVEIELSDISIVIFNDSKAALTKVKGNSIVKPRQNEKSLIIEQDLEISWLKMNGKWQIFVINGINLWE